MEKWNMTFSKKKFYSDDPEVSEAWFSSDACEYEKGETELELLKLWMSLHPEVEI